MTEGLTPQQREAAYEYFFEKLRNDWSINDFCDVFKCEECPLYLEQCNGYESRKQNSKNRENENDS